ncbi:MAG: PEP-CTERM sorting domain-containing protein [Pseudomonadota bacterium]
MKFKALGMIVALFWSTHALAIPVTVEAGGTGNYYDYTNNAYHYDAQIVQTWTFDTIDLPADSISDSNIGYHQSLTDWVDATVSVSTHGVTANEEAMTNDNAAYDYDYVYMEDGRYARDRYQVYSHARNNDAYVYSYAYFIEYVEDLVQGMNVAQNIHWIDNDGSDHGYGYARWYTLSGGQYATNAYVSYRADYFKVTVGTATVPEPGTFVLMLIGAAALLGFRRLRAQTQR